MDFMLLDGCAYWAQSGLLNLDLLNDTALNGLFFGQTFQDNLFSNVGQAWNNFIRTGQVWALIIGFVLGYLFRSVSAY
jgi:hypothetical protein